MPNHDSVAIVAIDCIHDIEQRMVSTKSGDCPLDSLDGIKALSKRYRIPPIYRNSLPDVLLKTLYTVEETFADIQEKCESFPFATTDVFFAGGQSFDVVQRNALRIKAFEFFGQSEGCHGNAFNELTKRLQGTFVDKLYELSASIASQIAVSFRCNGRIQSFDLGELSSARALEDAYHCLLAGHSDAVILASAQSASSLPTPASGPAEISESYSCVVLVRESDAQQLNLPIVCLLNEITTSYQPTFVVDKSAYAQQDVIKSHANAFIDKLHREVVDLNLKHTSAEFSLIAQDGGIANASIKLTKQKKSPYRRIKRRLFEPVAIIGMSNRFGLGSTPETFFHNARINKDCLTNAIDFPSSLFNSKGIHDLDRSYTKMLSSVSSVLSNNKTRSSLCFSNHPLWEQLDRSQKLAVTLANEAFLDASVRPDNSGRTGIFVGCNQTNHSSRMHLADQYAEKIKVEPWADLLLTPEWQVWWRDQLGCIRSNKQLSTSSSMLPIAIHRLLGLDAKLAAVQAACASSIAALDQACRALAQGDIDLALAGGIELGATLFELVLCSRMQLLSHDRITPFDVRADGFSIGEGGALFALKTEQQAIKDNDRIYAVIRGIGASCDANSMMAPCAKGQALAMQRAYEYGGMSPNDVDVLETHGTGTAKGDVVEYEAVDKVFRFHDRPRPLYLSSVKSMIGHTMAAAGSAGVLRAAMAIHHAELPTTACLQELNPKLLNEHGKSVFLTSPAVWEKSGTARRAAVNCFGTGGINYHLILEDCNHN